MNEPTKRENRSYTETERIGTMLLAIEHGVPHAAKETTTPESTIYSWLQDAGGIAQVRRFIEESELTARAQAKQALYKRVIKDLESGDIVPVHALDSFTRILEAESDGKLSSPPAQATAQVLMVQLRDGEVLELPRGIDGEATPL